ncbi:MAG TPA: hypothetical protein VHJ00_14620 [Bradyrhizobium sp.]|jgi:hypothetical protein|nr:hypothetical protein [Bradyrhizobium sp.]
MQEQATDVPVMSYAFKASLIGTAHRFELTEAGLSWRLAGRSGTWRYADISAVRLSFRPVWMQPHRFRADIGHKSGARLSIVSTSWQTAALMATQDNGYRDFIVALHQRMAAGGSTAELTGGLGRITYAAAVSLVTAVGLMLLGLFIRAIVIGEYAGALFFIGFAALFGWQIGGFVRRNRPTTYSFDHLPPELLP